jgi:hypothetical protein
MKYNYDEEFQGAICNTKKTGVKIDGIKFKDKRYFKQDMSLFTEKIVSTLMWLRDRKKLAGQPEYLPLALSIIGNCGPFHNYMKPIIERAFDCKSFLTLGYIKLNAIDDEAEKTFHKFGIEDIEKSITSSQPFPSNHHIWLTLDSGEILDMTFSMTYLSVNNKESFYKTVETKGLPLEFINKHYSELTDGMEYKPLFVGADILNKAGYNLKMLTSMAVWDTYPENV